MKKNWVFGLLPMILLGVLAAVCVPVTAQTQLTEAVNFHVKTPQGTPIWLFPLLDNDDKIVVIDFFSTGCGYCQTYAPDFQTSYEDFNANDGNVFFMTINWGSDNAAVMAFDSTFGLTMPTASGTQGGGNQVFNDYGILSYPTVIVITPDHQIFNQYIWPPTSENIDSVVLSAGGMMVGLEENRPVYPTVSIVPNPAKDHALLRVLHAKGSFGFDIADVNGHLVFVQKTTQKIAENATYQLPVHRLPSGNYFIRLYQNGNIFATKRLIVKR